MASVGPMAEPGARRTTTLVAASVVALGVAAAAALSTYHQFAAVDRVAQERREIATQVQASLAPRHVTPAAGSLETPVAALTRRPLDADALARAGLSAAIAGNAVQAKVLMAEALHRDPRSAAVRLWTLASALRDNDLVNAVEQLDRLMIIARDDRDAFFPALAEVMKQPVAERAIARVLAGKPEWRDRFLSYLTNAGQNPALVFRLTAHVPSATDGVQTQLIQKLIDTGNYDQAYLAWVNFLPESALDKVASVYDGGFSGLPGPRPFNWTFVDSNAASVGIEPGQGLQIDYPAAQTVQMASQTLVLKPGRYRLDFVAHGSADSPDGGAISWRIACLPDKSIALDFPIKGLRDQATHYGAPFTVPATCQAQNLTLEGGAGTFPQSRSLAIRTVQITTVAS